MLAVEGDKSPFSYLLASFLTRDGEEFAAAWHGVEWKSENLLTENPFWSFERTEALALDLYEAYRDSVMHKKLEGILKQSNPEYDELVGSVKERMVQLRGPLFRRKFHFGRRKMSCV